MSLQHRIDYSIALLRKAEPLALKMHPDGFYLASSGGKDSQVLYHIAKMSGVKFKAHMQITTLDPPELMHFVRTHYPDVELHHPEKNFYKLIQEKGSLPTRIGRWCCDALKEHAGIGTVTLVGIRAAESTKRAKRKEIERIHRNKKKRTLPDDLFEMTDERLHKCIGGKDKILLSPIFHWTDAEVWLFLRKHNIAYCKLYDEGWSRIGCIGCPMARKKERFIEMKRYPGVKRQIIRSISKAMENGGFATMKKYDATPEEIFDWWMSNKSIKKFFGMLRCQTKIDF